MNENIKRLLQESLPQFRSALSKHVPLTKEDEIIETCLRVIVKTLEIAVNGYDKFSRDGTGITYDSLLLSAILKGKLKVFGNAEMRDRAVNREANVFSKWH